MKRIDRNFKLLVAIIFILGLSLSVMAQPNQRRQIPHQSMRAQSPLKFLDLSEEQKDQIIPPAVLKSIIKLSVKYSSFFYDISADEQRYIKLEGFFSDKDLLTLINVNEFEGKTWYSSEFFTILIKILFFISASKNTTKPESGEKIHALPEDITSKIYSVFLSSDTRSENLFENLVENIKRDIKKI